MLKNISVILKATAWCHIYPELHFFKGPVYVNLFIYFVGNPAQTWFKCAYKTLVKHLKVRSLYKT